MKIKPGKAWSRLETFFLEPRDLTPMVICRIVFGLCLFFHYVFLVNDMSALFGPDGLMGFRLFDHIHWADEASRENIAWMKFLRDVKPLDYIYAVYVVTILASFAFAVGFATRTSGVIALVGHCLLHGQNEFAFWGWGSLIRPFMVYTLFAPVGERYSVDAWIRGSWRGVNRRVSAWPMRLMQVHVTTIYMTAAWVRLDDPNWWDGSMLYGTLSDPVFGRFSSDWRVGMTALVLACWAGWFIEFFAAFGLWIRRTRMAWAIALVVLHVQLEIFTKVGYWNFMMIAALSVFYLPSVILSGGKILADEGSPAKRA